MLGRRVLPKELKIREPGVLLATWFGAGLLPRAPGTWGSLAALPCGWAIVWAAGPAGLLAATLAIFAVGVWAAEDYVRRSGQADPGPVVIDEVAGQWLVLLPAPLDPVLYALGFVVFRLVDIVKPWPASWADRVVKGGFGVMLDDVLAAIYGLAAMVLIVWGMR